MEKKHFFDKPGNVKKVIWGLYIVCVLLIITDLFLPIHGEFAWEEAPGFFAAYGLVGCIMLVLAAKYILRPLVKRREDHYDD